MTIADPYCQFTWQTFISTCLIPPLNGYYSILQMRKFRWFGNCPKITQLLNGGDGSRLNPVWFHTCTPDLFPSF